VAASTAQMFVEALLCRYGSCAEVITDGKTEFAGEFHEVLKITLIDHKRTALNHPQAGGLAERAVQTIERSLMNLCEGSETPEKWDVKMPWLIFGYNCSTQASTRMSPYNMLHARHPVIPSAHVHNLSLLIDLNDPAEAEKSALHRAGVAKRSRPLWLAKLYSIVTRCVMLL